MIPIKFKKEALDYIWSQVGVSIQKRMGTILKNGKINRNGNPVELGNDLRNYLCKLQNTEELKKIILCLPEDFPSFIREFEILFPNSINRTGKVSNEPDYLIIESIFLDKGYDKFKKLNFIELIGLETCPYCNRNYIYSLDKKGKIKPQIDHFYPKSIYPILAASFYNLIPSCETCNGLSVKSSQDTLTKNVTNPYLIKHKDFRFSYDIVSLNLINPISSKGSIKVTLPEKLDENSELFKLEELYEKHEDHVLELIYKSQVQYSEIGLPT